ncbi:hypothetical protein [Pseudokineococcus sp. 1T1Z-3]|uniref:hypothetical protein n=1 Tax=Pseudokineococcus sp. 1T1Z-3 TaxID=3132745 RepID=UPI0030B0AE62
MSAKIKTIEDLAESLEDWRASRAAIDEAVAAADRKAADVRTAHETARTSGWSVAELSNLGLEPPAQPRRRRSSSNGTAGASTDGTDGDAARAADGDAPAPSDGVDAA